MLLRSLIVGSLLMLAPGHSSVGHPRHGIPVVDWQRSLVVHKCEGDSWNDKGPIYQGGLGWRPATWMEFGYPITHLRYAYQATVRQQILAMVAFAKKYGWPDLGGVCYGY